MKNFWNKFKLFWKELGNILTNLLCPILSILCALAELLHLPTSVINALKKAEHWAFYASATKPMIDSIIESADKKLEDEKIEFDEAVDLVKEGTEVVEKVVNDLQK
jgi:hypothetical protein